jgi:hypothetical protein
MAARLIIYLLPLKPVSGFGKEVRTMNVTLTIRITGVAAIMFILAGSVHGEIKEPQAVDVQTTMTKSYVGIKCDPCDYNIDYGDTDHPEEMGGVDEGFVKLECDPCDYDIDYGKTGRPMKK